MATGKVKWYNETKGFGFINADDGMEFFVHRSGLSLPYNGLKTDQKVEFETKRGEKGPVAFNVSPVK